jgi:chemotaxis protein methyltransferase CheR
MLIDREFPGAWDRWQLIGTDINQASLDKARAGTYTGSSMRALTESAWQRRYFARATDTRHELKSFLRQRVRFEIVELTGDDPAQAVPELGQVDLILCRNVTIYFDAVKRRQMLAMMDRRLRPCGWLQMGDTEVDDLVRERFQLHDRLLPSLFRRRPALPPAPPRVEAPPLPSTPAPPQTVTAEVWQVAGTKGLQAARALLLTRAAEQVGNPEVQVAMACLALAEADRDRALTALRRALLISAVPRVGYVLRNLQRASLGGDWAEQLIALAETVQKEASDVRRI